ncbi:MAG: SatD family protein [Candidatus Scalindua sp.]|nr:SatD family protein [Candidatus Scalindua sp.]
MENYYILMADVVASRRHRGNTLSRDLKQLVASCTTNLASGILSPYTVTLGDEFQGVAKSLHSALESIFYFEETTLKENIRFKLRYVLHYGRIETRLNRKIAHGMMGTGLTRTRELLNQKRRGSPRFLFELANNMLSNQLNRLFRVFDSLITGWREKDYLLISDMLENDNNEEVGARHEKNRSQIWKRRKHLRIEEYKILKEVVFDLIKGKDLP